MSQCHDDYETARSAQSDKVEAAVDTVGAGEQCHDVYDRPTEIDSPPRTVPSSK